MNLALQTPDAPEDVVDPAVVDAFFRAYAAREAEAFGAFLHDDVVWTINGPVDVIPYCGTHRGKAAVIDVMGFRAPRVLRDVKIVRERLLVDGNRVATLGRLSARLMADNRPIAYRVANFFRFQDGKLIENVSLLDSFDAAEQMLGHALDVGQDVTDAPPLADDNIVAI